MLRAGSYLSPETPHHAMQLLVNLLTAARMLGDAAHGAGIDVAVGQLYGMSQRGGSVQCTVLLGGGRSSFLTGGADVVVNRGTMVPYGLSKAGRAYPDFAEIVAELEGMTPRVTVVDGPGLLAGVGANRTLNVLMLGALAGLGVLPFGVEALWAAVGVRSPKGFLEANRLALDLGAGCVVGVGGS